MCSSLLLLCLTHALLLRYSPTEEEITLTRMLDKVLRRSDAVDKESLCVLAGQRVCCLNLN